MIPVARRHLARPDADGRDPRGLARRPDRDRPAGRHAHALERAAPSTASSSRSTPARMRRSAGWRRRTPPGRRRCATGRCARTCSRSRPCSRTAASSAPAAARRRPRPATTWLGLLIGSEGTLGVITELTLRLYGIPEQAVAAAALVPRRRVPRAGRPGDRRRGGGRQPAELLDALDDRRDQRPPGHDVPGRAVALRRGRRERAHRRRRPRARARDRARTRARSTSSSSATRPRARASGRPATTPRYAVAAACAGQEAPLDRRLRPALRARRRGLVRAGGARASRLVAGIVGHAGDGNVHLSLMRRPRRRGELRASDELIEALVDGRARARRDVHGRARHRRRQDRTRWSAEHGDLVPLMQRHEAVVDPNGILNPGKVLPGADVRRARRAPRSRRCAARYPAYRLHDDRRDDDRAAGECRRRRALVVGEPDPERTEHDLEQRDDRDLRPGGIRRAPIVRRAEADAHLADTERAEDRPRRRG